MRIGARPNHMGRLTKVQMRALLRELDRLRAALADAATCSNDECHGAHVAHVALGTVNGQ